MQRFRRPRGDDGVGLAEMLVAMVLTSIIGAVILASSITTQRDLRRGDDETQGLTDVRVVSERMSTDIRQARAVTCTPDTTVAPDGDPNCYAHLQVWIDFNSDYIQQPSEIVTWKLVPNGPDHFNVTRTAQGSTTIIEGRSPVTNFAFSYGYDAGGSIQPAPSFARTQYVTAKMTYDAVGKSGQSTNRIVTYSVRMRNVA